MKYWPTWYCKSIYELDYNKLKDENIKYILIDLDNTLAPFNVARPNDKTKKMIENLKNEGFKLVIVSNNTGKRVELFAKDLGLEYISGAKKPFTSTIKKNLKKKNIDINDCILVGDQIMTDIKCANKLKCRCILTEPLVENESIVTFINRRIDRHYRKKYNFKDQCKRLDRSDDNE